MNCYFLTGTFAFSVADSMDPGKHYCTVIGKRAFHCSEAVMQVLAAIDRQSDIGEITAAVNRARSGPALTEDTIRQLIVTRLIPEGLVRTSPQEAEAPKKSGGYLFVNRTILGPSAVNQVSRWFVFLFNRHIARLVLAVSCVLLAYWFWNLASGGVNPWRNRARYFLDFGESVLMYVLMLASFMFHEFGHAAASRRYGARPAEIGFGLYLIFPVFFCNVTDTWRLPKHQRIVVSLGGVYFQCIASALLVPFALISESRMPSLVIAANLLAILVTLNPFLRFDGYWVYSDFFSIPNLRKRANETSTAMFRRLFGGKADVEKTPNALRFYAAGSAVFFSAFTVLISGTAWMSFTAVPSQLAAARAAFGDAPGWEMALNIAAASGAYVFLLVGCVLSLLYAISTVVNGVRLLLKAAPMRAPAETRSTPHV